MLNSFFNIIFPAIPIAIVFRSQFAMSFFKPSGPIFTPKNEEEREEKERLYKEYVDFTSRLPVDEAKVVVHRQYQGFWFPEDYLPFILAARDHFQSQPTDLLLASYPKSGTTWLKALVFSIVRRTRHPLTVNNQQQDHPLLLKNPHELIGSLEMQVPIDPDPLASPRIFNSHSPFSVLPKAVKENSKIVYICRNPKDNHVSLFEFGNTVLPPDVVSSKEESFNRYCEGRYGWGPIWDHVLEYWYESKRRPSKVLFLKYEELKSDTVGNVKRLAEFLGVPFSEEEEQEGVVQGIVKLCSFENLSNLEVNKSGKLTSDLCPIEKSSFFRNGMTGDWKNQLTLEMAERLDQIVQKKLDGSGLSL